MIVEKIEDAGFEAYIVGGAVRDHLLNRGVHDIDITTSAPCEKIKEIFSHTADVALKHGTVIVCYNGEAFEVTTYRGQTLIEDLKLRDFTINAMVLTKAGDIIDPYLGREDIKHRLIRGVVNPRERFREDPLRMLRSFRFVSQLGFSIDQTTFAAIQSESSQITKVAIERIASEFEKIFLGANAKKAFQLLNSSSISCEIPQLKEISKSLSDDNVIFSISSLKNITEVWSLLLFISEVQDCQTFLRCWKQPKKVINEVDSMISRLPMLLKRGFNEEDLYFLGLETVEKAERVRALLKNEAPNIHKVTSQYYSLPIKDKKQLAINGTDIIDLLKDEKPKERIGQVISLVEKAVLTQVVENKKKAIIHWLREEGYVNA